MDKIRCIPATHLPGDAAVMISQRGTSVHVYLSGQHDVPTLAAALNAAIESLGASVVTAH